jgi:hypothetical protein
MQQIVPAKSAHIDGSNRIRIRPLLKKSLALDDNAKSGLRLPIDELAVLVEMQHARRANAICRC